MPKRRPVWSLEANPNAPELLASLREHARAKDLELFVGDGWLPLVRECHAAVLAEFPDYELLAVKQKYGQLAFQAFVRPGSTGTDEEYDRMADIREAFRERSAETCERCGAGGELRDLDGLFLTLCAPCFAHR